MTLHSLHLYIISAMILALFFGAIWLSYERSWRHSAEASLEQERSLLEIRAKQYQTLLYELTECKKK